MGMAASHAASTSTGWAMSGSAGRKSVAKVSWKAVVAVARSEALDHAWSVDRNDSELV